MALYKLDSGIPLPTKQPRVFLNGKPAKYPIRDMEPGMSFFVPAADITSKGGAKGVVTACQVKAKKMGWKLAHLIDETGVRIWRAT